MSCKPSFANLRSHPARDSPRARRGTQAAETGAGGADTTPRPTSREGCKQIAGFFSSDMSRVIHMLTRRQDRSLQSLMAEAFNDAFRKYGKNLIGD